MQPRVVSSLWVSSYLEKTESQHLRGQVHLGVLMSPLPYAPPTQVQAWGKKKGSCAQRRHRAASTPPAPRPL